MIHVKKIYIKSRLVRYDVGDLKFTYSIKIPDSISLQVFIYNSFLDLNYFIKFTDSVKLKYSTKYTF